MALLGQERIPEAYAEAIDDAVICRITSDELRRIDEVIPVHAAAGLRYPEAGMAAVHR